MRRPPVARRQRGAALIVLMVIVVMGSSAWLLSALSTPVNRTALDRERNARVLQEAKAALIGYVAHLASQSGEEDPGRLPCPQNWGDIGTANEGRAGGTCIAGGVAARGWLPWRTLGIDRPRDASGEQIWYVISPGWALPTGGGNLLLNSSSTGAITVDGLASVVAVLITPGPAIAAQACGGAPARTQSRGAMPPNVADYLECQHAVTPIGNALTATGAGSNDQVITITAGDLLPAIEAAVASRLVREFGAQMRYCGAPWPACNVAVKYPFASSFADPAASSFQGALNVRQGLLPLSFSSTGPCQTNTPVAPFCAAPAACNPATDPRCIPNLVTYASATITQSGGAGDANLADYTCTPTGGGLSMTCTLRATHSIFSAAANRYFDFTLNITSNNVGMALRRLNPAIQITGIDVAANPPYGYAMTSAALNANGSATVSIAARVQTVSGGGLLSLVGDLLCGLDWLLGLFADCNEHTVTVPFMWLDEPMLYSTDATLAWFYRNAWHQHMYYAVSQGNAPSGGGTCAGGTCLSIAGATTTDTHRAVLLTPGAGLAGQNRPPGVVGDWLEGGNTATPLNATQARHPTLVVNRGFNDHALAIGSN